ncbi:MAG: XRE family transcriptional regulator [Proteobacteria bacterium]|nr:MAG: XRE family transcriptional regulator [Pseudomonadota bacterium]
MVNEQALLADLVDAINAWMEGGRGRSLSGLARRTGVAYSTIRRIAQNESVPHPYTALAISEVVMLTHPRLEFLKKHFPTIGNLMEECYPQKIETETNTEALQKYLRMEPHNRIFNIAATVRGTSRRAIERLCGQVGIDALNDMLEEGILVELNEGTIKYTNDSWTQSNIDEALSQVRHSTKHFDKNLIGTVGASLMHSTGSIKREKIPEVKELVLKFIKDLSALKNDEASVGDIHFFCDLMYSLYDRREWLPNEELNQ